VKRAAATIKPGEQPANIGPREKSAIMEAERSSTLRERAVSIQEAKRAAAKR
jgi:hypothetical protein